MDVEQLTFPGMSRSDALALAERLAAMEDSGRLFVGGLSGMPVAISWSLGYPRASGWRRTRDGSLSAHLWLDLASPLNQPGGRSPAGPEGYCWAFRAGLLHALGRLLGSDPPAEEERPPLEAVIRREHPRWRRTPREVREQLAEPQTLAYLYGLLDVLEGARTDALTDAQFRGAAVYLEPRVAWARALTGRKDPALRLVGLACLTLRGRVDDEALTDVGEAVLAAYRHVQASLRQVMQVEGPAGGARLAEVLVYDLYPRLYALNATPERPTQADGSFLMDEREQQGLEARDMFICRSAEFESGRTREAVGTRIVRLPHSDGGLIMVRTDFAEASDLEPDRLVRAALKPMVERYGPEASEAFADESAALRRALQVNYERRYRGRYRSGKRVGISNLRRYVVHNDLRLFQRLERPDALSYYFHILVDVSYSMLENQNVSKALAVAYAFTRILWTLRVPVDVTLYSSGITELFDHRRHALLPFFGGDFGYLVSGTLEIEALGYAKEKADLLSDRQKIFVVVTDATPVGASLGALGATGIEPYYRDTLLPWLHAAGIDVVAMGIGVEPKYHERSVTLTEGWESICIFLELLETMIREGDRRERELWE